MLKNPKATNNDILLIVANQNDLLTVVENVDGIKKVNIGNYGILEKDPNVIRKRYNEYFWFSEEEAKIYQKIIDKGLDCTIQIIPDDKPDDLKEIFKM